MQVTLLGDDQWRQYFKKTTDEPGALGVPFFPCTMKVALKRREMPVLSIKQEPTYPGYDPQLRERHWGGIVELSE